MSSSDSKPLWRAVYEFPLSAMVIAIAICVLGIALVSFAGTLLPDGTSRDVSDIVSGTLSVIVLIIFYKLAIRHLGERKHDDLPLGIAVQDTARGLAFGFVLFSTVVAAAALFGVYRITGKGGWSDFVPILMQTGVVAGFVEELIFRGILFRWIEEMAGSWAALAITSALFGFAHAANANATLFSSLAIAIEAGILLGGAYMLTRSLWLAVGIHAGWNVTQGFVWNVPVSGYEFEGLVTAELEGPALLAGGGFGLEATVFALVIATGAGVWMVWKAVQKGHVVAPMWKHRVPEQPPAT